MRETRLNHPFLNFDWDQPVNQWLGIAIISVMCFWTVMYYVVHTADSVGAGFVTLDNDTIRSAAEHIREHSQHTPSPSILPE